MRPADLRGFGPVGTNVPSVGKPDPIVAQWQAPIVAAARMHARYAGKGTIPALVRRAISAVVSRMLAAADLTVAQRHALARLYRDTVANPEE